jgi:hypothetical protein
MHQEQHEEWISRHNWGAPEMDRGAQRGLPHDDEPATEEMVCPSGEEEILYGTAAPPTPRIVEGTLVVSPMQVPPRVTPSTPPSKRDLSPARALRCRVQQGLLTVLVALATALVLVPTQAPVMCLLVRLVPAAGATATITLVTDQVELHRMYTLLAIPAGLTVPMAPNQRLYPKEHIQARLLAAPTLMQQVTVPTTGRGHQPAMQAHGLVTFYNQAPAAQIIPAGMLLSGAHGVQVVNERAVVVPAAHLPMQGQVSVAAHALQAGPSGNIRPDDLDGPCCFAGIAVQNQQAFVGGANARDFPVVGARDVSLVAAPLAATLTTQGQAALQTQVRAREQLLHPVQCSPRIVARPAVGEEATQVTIRVSVPCMAEAYNTDEVQSRVTALLKRDATMHLESAYVLQGEVSSTLSAVTDVDARRGIVNLHVQAEGLWAYQLSATQLHHLTALIAGKHQQEARTILLRMQGIHQVTVASTDWWDGANQQTLPRDPGRMKVLVISWGGS